MTQTKVGIIDGYGRAGTETAQYLARCENLSLLIGGRDRTAAQNMAATLGEKVRGCPVDVFSRDTLDAFFDRVASLKTYFVGKDRWTFSSAYDIASGMDELDTTGAEYFENGRLEENPEGMTRATLPFPIGKIRVFPFFSRELGHVAAQYEVRSARGYFNNSGRWVFLAMAFIKMFRRYRTDRQKRQSANLIIRAAGRDMKNSNP